MLTPYRAIIASGHGNDPSFPNRSGPKKRNQWKTTNQGEPPNSQRSRGIGKTGQIRVVRRLTGR